MKIEISEKILFLQLAWIETAASKAASLFAINTTMLGLLVTLIKFFPKWTIIGGICGIIAASILIISTGFLMVTMFPKLDSSINSFDSPENSNIFFGGITQQDIDTYTSKMKNLSSDGDEYQDDILNQIYRNAALAHFKYKCIQWAFRCTFASSLPWLVAIYSIGETSAIKFS